MNDPDQRVGRRTVLGGLAATAATTLAGCGEFEGGEGGEEEEEEEGGGLGGEGGEEEEEGGGLGGGEND